MMASKSTSADGDELVTGQTGRSDTTMSHPRAGALRPVWSRGRSAVRRLVA